MENLLEVSCWFSVACMQGQPSLTSACHVEDLQMCKDMMEELFAAGACINGTSQDMRCSISTTCLLT